MYTGSFNAFPGKGNLSSPNRDSGISLLDILDEQRSMDSDEDIDPAQQTIDKEILRRQNDHNTFAREGTVHNPLYLDDEEGDGIDPKSVQANPDDLVPDPIQREDDDFKNIFDDDYFKDGPVTLLSYAKKHEDDKKEDNLTNDSSSDDEDLFGPQYEPIKDQPSPNPHYATIPRKQAPPPDDSDSDSDILMEPPPQYDANAPIPDSPPSSPKKPLNDPPPNLLRTGSVAKLVDAFTKGKITKDDERPDDGSNDDGVKKRTPHAYKNPLYQEEDNLMSYANPMYKDDETPSPGSDEPLDEHQYLAPVDGPDTKKDHKEQDPVSKMDEDIPTPTSNDNDNDTPVPSPRPLKASSPTNLNIDDPKHSKDDGIKKPRSQPPTPPPVSTKPKKKDKVITPNSETPKPVNTTKKQPPPVAPKRVSLKEKTPLDRALSLQPNQKAPAPPPRVRSVRL